MEKSDIQLIKFSGKNYNWWAYQFELYQKGKNMSGSKMKSTDDNKIEDWQTKEAQIISWILESIDP